MNETIILFISFIHILSFIMVNIDNILQVLNHLGRSQPVDNVGVRHEAVAGDVGLGGLGLCAQPQRE